MNQSTCLTLEKNEYKSGFRILVSGEMGKMEPGTLVECDPSIKSIIISIDKKNNDYIIEDLDETHLVIKDNMVNSLKQELDRRLKENVPAIDDDSDSDEDVK
ncbi:transcription factor TFIIH complex subunit Tfb5-domain-containing protein [Annulohypoxylon nitens]|nr:transcription factor TFIIH complex subunit Tfb5-domain-containing protein [Annulohypoxylon nitens]